MLATEELFPGTGPAALVELAELARRERDPARAREYLDAASKSVDIDDSTIVKSLIVRGRLLTDEGNTADAESVWQSILTHPSASGRHRQIAANRGAAVP